MSKFTYNQPITVHEIVGFEQCFFDLSNPTISCTVIIGADSMSAAVLKHPAKLQVDQLIRDSILRYKKCIRKGEIICFANEENIHMANTPHKHIPTKTTLDSPKSMDRVSSGESLYKTFTFTQSPNDEDTEKCIAFWRSVMEKNLEPVRCSIVESREYQSEENVEKEPCEGLNESDPKTKMKETKEEVNIEDQIDEKLKVVHKEYREMWDKAIKQIQKQKLDKIKLVGRTRCKMCETLNAPFKEDVCEDQATIDKEIKDLSKWKSSARKKAYVAGSSRGPRTHQEKPKQKSSSKLQKAEEIHPTDPNATEDIQKQVSLEETPRKMKPSTDSNTYEFVDAIENKRRSGKYSEWRSNTVQETCNCGHKICCCNTNPAVKDIIPQSYLPSMPVVNIDKTSKKTDSRTSVEKKVTEKQPRRSSISMKSENISTLKDLVKKELSILIQCECSAQSCDCKEELQTLSRTKLPEEQWDIPPPPELHPLPQKRSSIEIYKEKLNISDRNMARSVSDEALRYAYGEGSNYEDDPPPVVNKEQPICTQAVPDTPVTQSNLAMKKTVSLVVQGCGCGMEDCDCFVVEEATRLILPPEVYTTSDKIPNVSVKPLLERKDTLELALEKKYPKKDKQSVVPPENTSSIEAKTEANHPKPISADPVVPYEPEDLQMEESTIIVRKDSIELTYERSGNAWTGKYSDANVSQLKKDKHCYEQIGKKSEDICGNRDKNHSISLGPTRTNANKLLKKISFSAKSCRCTNSKCDCYNVMLPNGIESDLESEVDADGWKEPILGYDSDKDSMKVIMAIQNADKKATLTDDVSSLAASQFLDFSDT